MKLFGKYRNVREMLEKEDPNFLQQKFPHGKPMTRRELLNAGAISFAATATMPPLLNMLARPETALADECKGQDLPGFITINLGGGAAMGSQIIPKRGPTPGNRDYLDTSSNKQLGLGSPSQMANNFVNSEFFGGTEWFSASGFLLGIQDAVAAQGLDPATGVPEILKNVASAVAWCPSQNDSRDNKQDLSGMVTKVRNGKLLQNLGTLGNEPAGIGQKPALVVPPTPVVIANSDSVDEALGVSGIFGSEREDALNLSTNQKYEVARTIAHLSNEQCKKLQGANGGFELCKLLEEASGVNTMVISAEDKGTDPLRDPLVGAILNNIWADQQGTTLDTLNNGSMTKVGAYLTYNVLKGNAATAGINMGGYDYHGAPSRVSTDTDDRSAGYMMGQVIATAWAMKKPLFLVVTSDGGVDGPGLVDQPGVEDHTSDYGQASGIYMFAYHPEGRPPVATASGQFDYQVGHFRSEDGTHAVDTNFFTSNDEARAAAVAFVNYCQFAGHPELIEQVLPRVFTAAEIDEITRIWAVG